MYPNQHVFYISLIMLRSRMTSGYLRKHATIRACKQPDWKQNVGSVFSWSLQSHTIPSNSINQTSFYGSTQIEDGWRLTARMLISLSSCRLPIIENNSVLWDGKAYLNSAKWSYMAFLSVNCTTCYTCIPILLREK